LNQIEELFKDRKRTIETLVQIDNKDRQKVPFILNPVQQLMYSEGTSRDITVKPAQAGGTSFYICDALLDCITIPETTTVIISYDEFITGRLLRKAQALYDNIKNLLPTIPEIYKKSTYEKTFQFIDSQGKKRGESSMYIASAKGFSMPRGEPIHYLICDEFAFWPEGAAADVFAAAINRVPLRSNTKIKVLSTPNGEANDFFKMYMAAKEGKEIGKSVFTHHFYTWYILPEYEMPVNSQFALPGDDIDVLLNLTDEELTLIERFKSMGIDELHQYDKLRWRRFKIAESESLNRSGETKKLFSQEFPEDDVSCFLSAGDSYFDSITVNMMAKECYPAPDHINGVDVWEAPQTGINYIIPIDPGLGKTSESVAEVFRCVPGEMTHVATMSGLYPDYEMAQRCKELGIMYNWATLCPEDALGIVGHLKDYPELYHRVDPVTGLIGNQIGWSTSPRTKPYMMTALAKHLSQIQTHDIRIIEQLRNIRWDGGKAVNVGKDDYVMCAALGVVCNSNSGMTEYEPPKPYGWKPGWGDVRNGGAHAKHSHSISH
jgi:hypothetical protein